MGWERGTEIFTYAVLYLRFELGVIKALYRQSSPTIMVLGPKMEYGPSNIDLEIMI